MRAPGPARPGRLAAVLGAVALLAGCARQPMPYAITAMAVLPTDVTPYHQASGRQTAEYVTAALSRKTTFRVVGIDSTTRLLAGPQGQEWYQRFRDQAKTAGWVPASIATLLARRTNTNGLLLPSLQVRMSGLVDGQVALALMVFEPETGERVWMNRLERSFRGYQGDPGFLRVVREMAEELVDSMPRPAGEEVWN